MANGKKAGKKAKANRRNDLARRRGRNFEWRVARYLDGVPWPGQDGDVEAHGWRIECKSRQNWRGINELPAWIKQAKGYTKKWPPNKKWCLAITGGHRTGMWFLVPDYLFRELIVPKEEECSG
jgi:hypothetical protein